MELKLPMKKHFQNENRVCHNSSYCRSNKIREFLLLLVDSEIPQTKKSQINFQIHFEQEIISPIKAKYFSFSTKNINQNNESTISSSSSQDLDSKKVQLNKLELSKNQPVIPSNKSYKLTTFNKKKKQDLLKKGLLYLKILSKKFRNLNLSFINQEKTMIEKPNSFRIKLYRVPFNQIEDLNKKMKDDRFKRNKQKYEVIKIKEETINITEKCTSSKLLISDKCMHSDNLKNPEKNESKILTNIQHSQFPIPSYICPVMKKGIVSQLSKRL